METPAGIPAGVFVFTALVSKRPSVSGAGGVVARTWNPRPLHPQSSPQHVDNGVGNRQRQRVERITPMTITPKPISRFQLLNVVRTGTVVLMLAVT